MQRFLIVAALLLCAIGLVSPATAQQTVKPCVPRTDSSSGIGITSCQDVTSSNPLPTSAAAASTAPNLAVASTLVLKASAGNLLDAYVTASSAGYLFVFNSTSAPVNGSVTAGTATGDYQDCIYVPAAGSQSLSAMGLPSESFSTGITLAWSSTGCSTLTLATPLLLKGRAQ